MTVGYNSLAHTWEQLNENVIKNFAAIAAVIRPPI